MSDSIKPSNCILHGTLTGTSIGLHEVNYSAKYPTRENEIRHSTIRPKEAVVCDDDNIVHIGRRVIVNEDIYRRTGLLFFM